MNCKVLLVEDNESITEINNDALKMEGYTVFTAATLESARNIVSSKNPDIIVLDIMMPDGSGIEFCNELRETCTIPIIFLTCLNERKTIVEGLRSGGDDYLTKPYHIDELIARIESLVRRIKIERKAEIKELSIGAFIIDPVKRKVYLHQENLWLTPKEFSLLMFFVNHENVRLTAEEIYTAIWGEAYPLDIRTVRVHIASLRKKLNLDENVGININTIQRQYYIFTRNEPLD